jgi:hypothetical protein
MRVKSMMIRFACFVAPLGAVFALATSASTSGCAASYDPAQTTKVLAPDYDIYATYLDTFLNRRCGTLDCHGAAGRAFRHYGSLGLRRLEGKADEFSGDASVEAGALGRRAGIGVTTPDEIRANYAGIIALEPEVISRIVALNGDLSDNRELDWMFLRKALGRPSPGSDKVIPGERHKGGNVLRQSDDGYLCIRNWLRAPRKPDTWREASAGDGGSAGTRANPTTALEKEYAAYLALFDKDCVASLAGYK